MPNHAPYPVSLRVRLNYSDVKSFVERYGPNVSSGGLFIQSRTPQPVGTAVYFELLLKDGTPLINGSGQVVWTKEYCAAQPDDAHGMGVRFIDLDPPSQLMVDQIIAHNGESRGAGTSPLTKRKTQTEEVVQLETSARTSDADEPEQCGANNGADLPAALRAALGLCDRAESTLQELMQAADVPPELIATTLHQAQRLDDPLQAFEQLCAETAELEPSSDAAPASAGGPAVSPRHASRAPSPATAALHVVDTDVNSDTGPLAGQPSAPDREDFVAQQIAADARINDGEAHSSQRTNDEWTAVEECTLEQDVDGELDTEGGQGIESRLQPGTPAATPSSRSAEPAEGFSSEMWQRVEARLDRRQDDTVPSTEKNDTGRMEPDEQTASTDLTEFTMSGFDDEELTDTGLPPECTDSDRTPAVHGYGQTDVGAAGEGEKTPVNPPAMLAASTNGRNQHHSADPPPHLLEPLNISTPEAPLDEQAEPQPRARSGIFRRIFGRKDS